MLPLKRDVLDVKQLYAQLQSGQVRVVAQHPDTAASTSDAWDILSDKKKKLLDWTFNPNGEAQKIPLVCVSATDNYLIEYFVEEEKFKLKRGQNPTVQEYFEKNRAFVETKAQELENKDTSVPKKSKTYYLNDALYELPVKHIKYFKISYAAGIYSYLGSKVVLDPNMEFGGRLMGASISGVTVYHGLNPLGFQFPKTMEKFLNKDNYYINPTDMPVQTPGLVEINAYDTILTELLFMEQFGTADKFKDPNDWLIREAYPFIAACVSALVSKGYLALYFPDTRMTKYMTPIQQYCTQFMKMQYVGVIGCAKSELNFVSAVLVWRKS